MSMPSAVSPLPPPSSLLRLRLRPRLPSPHSAPLPPQQDINPVMPNPIFTQSFDAQPAAKQAPAEEEDDGDYFDDLLSILNKRS